MLSHIECVMSWVPVLYHLQVPSSDTLECYYAQGNLLCHGTPLRGGTHDITHSMWNNTLYPRFGCLFLSCNLHSKHSGVKYATSTKFDLFYAFFMFYAIWNTLLFVLKINNKLGLSWAKLKLSWMIQLQLQWRLQLNQWLKLNFNYFSGWVVGGRIKRN